MSKLHDVAAAGQSIWLDNLRRDMVSSGELSRLIRDAAVTGVTSNPTILAAAITASGDYDERIADLAREGASTADIYRSIVAEDIQKACDVFRPVWERTQGQDGFVSVEVSPAVAQDASATVVEARDWIKRIDRDNLLVKVPATPAGIDAIEQLTAEGVSVNVTLIFSLRRYRAVAEAYISGLQRFVSSGGDAAKVVSFASFFVSRVDTEVDGRIDQMMVGRSEADQRGLEALRGRAGIANARAAYGVFGELFSGPRWKILIGRGAHVQRPLWASTGVKDPSYRDTMYVEDLFAPLTVNTMPEATLEAFQDHGDTDRDPFSPAEVAEARETLVRFSSYGIDVQKIADDVLEPQGVAKFEKSFDELIDHLTTKARAAVVNEKA